MQTRKATDREMQIAARRVEKLRAHLARPGKVRDMVAALQQGRCRRVLETGLIRLLDIASYNERLRELYSPSAVTELRLADNPLFRLLS